MRTLLRTLSLSLSLAAPALLLAQSPLAAPGLYVPGGNIPFALDQFDHKPQLVPVHHSAVEVNNHKGANIAGSIAGSVFYKPKMTTELPGPHARTLLHSTRPVFFLHLAPDPDDPEAEVWSLIRATAVKDRRVFAKIQFTQITNNAKRLEGLIPIDTETLPNNWLKITPKEPLEPGEYALNPVMKAANTYAVYVYDFTLDPAQPNAPDAVQPSN